MVRYRSSRPPDTELRTQLRDLANERERFGYRRLFVLLRQAGEPSGINRIYRLYREEGLTVRKRWARRRAVGSRVPILVESKSNARWSVDFVHDQLASGRRLRILNIVDDVMRECLAAGEGLGLLENWLGCPLPESQQEGGFSVGAVGPQGASRWRDYPPRSVRARSFAP